MKQPAWEIRQGDVLDRLREMPDESVHCVVTSPPYWGLRDYGTAAWDGGDPECGHVGPPKRTAAGFNERYFGKEYATDKQGKTVNEPYRDICGRCGARRVDQQHGLEATPAEYIARMVAVFREVRRVMRSDATLFCNMGDGYQDKQLLMMPARLALALQADGWILRSEIIWAKPNPMPESVTDRPTKAHEQIFLLTKAARYYYDADAIREVHATGDRVMVNHQRGPVSEDFSRTFGRRGELEERTFTNNPAGRNARSARSVWSIATQPYAEAHFATFPEELPKRCILAGTSERGVCPECAAPWRRVVEREAVPTHGSRTPKVSRDDTGLDAGQNWNAHRTYAGTLASTTTGWEPTCAHVPEPVPAVVLDPFSGSGTTGLVAVRHGRSYIGIELNPAYASMSEKRILADHGAVEPTNGHAPREGRGRGTQGRLAL